MMLQKLGLTVAILLLGALPAAAGSSPCADPDDLSWLFEAAPAISTPTAPAAAATVALASTGDEPTWNLTCNVTEDCNELPDIGCSGSTCNAVSRNCSIGNRGHVTCDGNTTYCSEPCDDPDPPECTLQECKAGCAVPGCFSFCVNQETCECDFICH